MSDVKCPKCGNEHSIHEMELYEVYDEDGKETKMECHNCGETLVITSRIIGWRYEVEIEEG